MRALGGQVSAKFEDDTAKDRGTWLIRLAQAFFFLFFFSLLFVVEMMWSVIFLCRLGFDSINCF